MQNWSRDLGTAIEALQKEYGNSCTKLLDEYNWKKCGGMIAPVGSRVFPESHSCP
jgi:hypothetical protein